MKFVRNNLLWVQKSLVPFTPKMENKMPETINFYNKTKRGDDTFEQMTHKYTQ